MKKLTFISLLLVIVSCTSTKSISEKFDNNSENGIFYGILSFPKQKTHMSSFNLFYRLKGTEAKKKHKQSIYIKNSVVFRSVTFNADYETDDEYIYLFAIEVPLGKYEFYQTAFTEVVTQGWLIRESNPFSLEFDIEKGSIVYVGNYKYFEKGNNYRDFLKINNNKQKADEYFKLYRKDINWIEAVNQVPKY